MSGQTFHFCTIISALPLSTDHSLFLLAVGLANGAAPRITELTDKLFTILIFRLGPNEVLFENEFCKLENKSFAGYWLHLSPPPTLGYQMLYVTLNCKPMCTFCRYYKPLLWVRIYMVGFGHYPQTTWNNFRTNLALWIFKIDQTVNRLCDFK